MHARRSRAKTRHGNHPENQQLHAHTRTIEKGSRCGWRGRRWMELILHLWKIKKYWKIMHVIEIPRLPQSEFSISSFILSAATAAAYITRFGKLSYTFRSLSLSLQNIAIVVIVVAFHSIRPLPQTHTQPTSLARYLLILWWFGSFGTAFLASISHLIRRMNTLCNVSKFMIKRRA